MITIQYHLYVIFTRISCSLMKNIVAAIYHCQARARMREKSFYIVCSLILCCILLLVNSGFFFLSWFIVTSYRISWYPVFFCLFFHLKQLFAVRWNQEANVFGRLTGSVVISSEVCMSCDMNVSPVYFFLALNRASKLCCYEVIFFIKELFDYAKPMFVLNTKIFYWKNFGDLCIERVVFVCHVLENQKPMLLCKI